MEKRKKIIFIVLLAVLVVILSFLIVNVVNAQMPFGGPVRIISVCTSPPGVLVRVTNIPPFGGMFIMPIPPWGKFVVGFSSIPIVPCMLNSVLAGYGRYVGPIMCGG